MSLPDPPVPTVFSFALLPHAVALCLALNSILFSDVDKTSLPIE